MTRTLKTVFSAGLLVAFLSGCASVPKDAGFGDVHKTVAERTGKRIEWYQGGPEDKAVAAAVRTMLNEELTADRAVQVALLNNPRLQATYENLGIAQANLVQAGLLKNPVFNAGILFRGAAPVDLEFSVIQDFLSILFLPARRQVAADQFEAVKFNVTGAVMDLTANVRTAFYSAQAQEQTVEFLRQVVETTGAAYDVAKRLHEAGNITDVTLANERALYEDSKLALADAELERAKRRERLNVLMGLWGADTQWNINPRLPEIPNDIMDLNGLETRAIGASLDLAAARKRIESVARILGITNATALIPELEL
ncbi:MAG: TolC family protein, partial [Burkholderiales bacterium]